MKMKLYDTLLATYGKTNPIFIKELNIENMTKESIRMGISRLVKDGKLRRKSSGVYYIPESIKTLNVEKALSISTICQKKYIEDKDGIIGFYTGLYLLNRLGFITQVPTVLEIVTNKEKRQRRTINIDGQTRILKRPYVKVTSDNEKHLQLLELLRILGEEDYKKDKSKKYKNIKYYIKKRNVNLNETKKYICYYPSKVAKRLVEVETELT